MVHRHRPRPPSGQRPRLLVALLVAALVATSCSVDVAVDRSPLAAEPPADVTTTTSGPPDALAFADDDEDTPALDPPPKDDRGSTPTSSDPRTAVTNSVPDPIPVRADPIEPTIEWTDCGDRLECATVEVPTDYRDPSLGTLDIAVNVLRSPNPDARVGHLFVNPGGPGVSGVEFVEELWSYGFPPALLESFDIVGFDPRGVGASEPAFACGVPGQQFALLDQIDDELNSATELAAGERAAELCIATMGPAGALLHSEYVARDMDRIRQAIGADQISYLGFSYGSSLGGWYASLFPDRVRAMVVDGAANPLAARSTLEQTISQIRNSYGEFHDRLDDALAACDRSCPIWNDGDPHGYWFDMVDKFDLVLQAENGNGDAVFFAIIGHLYSESQWPDLYAAARDLAEFDDPTAFLAAVEYAGDIDGPSITAHVNCLDRWALFPDDSLDDQLDRAERYGPAIAEHLDGQYPLLDAVNMPSRWDACLFYEAIDPPEFVGTYDGGGVPILVVANTDDPFTSFASSEAFATDVLADGRLVEVAHRAHTVYPNNSCVVELVHETLIDRTYPTDRSVCPREG